MKKLISSIFLIIGIVAAQAFTAFAQDDVIGYWKTGGLGMMQERNTVTGATKNNRGTSFSYKFAANGTYQFIGYMESTMFGCTTALFNQIDGKYSVDGSTINLNPSKDFWRNTYSCFPNNNKQQNKTPTRKTLEFGHKTDEYCKLFLCLNDAGTETCYRQEKE
jgi:hypothetical protein